MGNCFAHESSAKSKSKSKSRPIPSPRAASPVNVDATSEKKQPLSPTSQASQTPNYTADRNKVKKKVRFADDVVCSGPKEEAMKVKMVMRKKDAALLLAMLGGNGDNQSAMDCMLSKLEVVQGAGRRKRDMDSKSNQLIAMDTK